MEWQAQPPCAPGLEGNVWDATRVSWWRPLTGQHSPAVGAWVPLGQWKGFPELAGLIPGPGSGWRQPGAAGVAGSSGEGGQQGAVAWAPQGTGEDGEVSLCQDKSTAALQCAPQPWAPEQQCRQGAAIL